MELETLHVEMDIFDDGIEKFEELIALRRALRAAEYSNPDALDRIEHGIESYLFGPNGAH